MHYIFIDEEGISKVEKLEGFLSVKLHY